MSESPLTTLTLAELDAVHDVRRKALCMFATWRATKEQEPRLLEAYRALIEVEAEIAKQVGD